MIKAYLKKLFGFQKPLKGCLQQRRFDVTRSFRRAS